MVVTLVDAVILVTVSWPVVAVGLLTDGAKYVTATGDGLMTDTVDVALEDTASCVTAVAGDVTVVVVGSVLAVVGVDVIVTAAVCVLCTALDADFTAGTIVGGCVVGKEVDVDVWRTVTAGGGTCVVKQVLVAGPTTAVAPGVDLVTAIDADVW